MEGNRPDSAFAPALAVLVASKVRKEATATTTYRSTLTHFIFGVSVANLCIGVVAD